MPLPSAITGLCLGLLIIVVELCFGFPIHRALGGGADRIVPLTKLDRGRNPRAHGAPTRSGSGRTVWRCRLCAASPRQHLCHPWVVGRRRRLRLRTLAAAPGGRVGYRRVCRPISRSAACPGDARYVTWLAASAPWLRVSALHRLVIWRFTSDRIAEHPLLGWGMRASYRAARPIFETTSASPREKSPASRQGPRLPCRSTLTMRSSNGGSSSESPMPRWGRRSGSGSCAGLRPGPTGSYPAHAPALTAISAAGRPWSEIGCSLLRLASEF
jgi:hypothetical protein